MIDGEFMERGKIVAGLTLEQANHRLSEQSHSIYEELWHTVTWQNIVTNRDEGLYEEWKKGHDYPPDYPPQHTVTEEEWNALVKEFKDGLERALGWTLSEEKLNMETDPGVTMADVLQSLAVHSSYHLGKIVAIRQAIGAWPPESQA